MVILVIAAAVPALAQTLAGGELHTLILKPDGTVWSVGDNFYGQLGDATNTARATPVQVTGAKVNNSIQLGLYLLLTASLMTGCADAANRAAKAHMSEPGTALADLVSKVGRPSREIALPVSGVRHVCSDDLRNVKAVEYDAETGFLATLRAWTGSVPPVTAVCVDRDDRITKTHMIQS